MLGEFTDECISFPRRRVRREWQSWLPLVDHSIHGDGLLSLGCSWFFERRNRQEDAYPDGCDRGGLTAAPEAPPLQSAVGIAPTLQSGSSPAQAGVVTHSVAALRSATAESAEESQVLTESSTSSAEPPVGIASEPESHLSSAQTIVMAPSVPARQDIPEKGPPKLEKVVVLPMERAGLWPPNDPDFKNCLRNGNGVRLQWQSTNRAKPIYLMVMQRHDGGGWETWVEKTRVSGVAFALALRSAQARNSEFQWVLFQSQSNIPHESNYFCTRG